MKSKEIRLCSIGIGLAMIIGSIYLLQAEKAPEGAVRTVLCVCIAIGCFLSGSALRAWLQDWSLQNAPDVRKEIDIEKRDERNQMITNRAKAKAFDLYVCVFSVLLWALALMKTERTALLLLFAAHCFVLGTGLYYRSKLEKEL